MSKRIPNERNYTHRKCGTVTAVSGNDFDMLADPFSVLAGTHCVGCQTHFPLDKFSWDDTGERVSEARERLAAQVPDWVRVGNGRPGCLIMILGGAAVGVLGGLAVGRAVGGPAWVGPTAGGVVGLVVAIILFGQIGRYVMRHNYGVESYRQLT